LVYDQRFLDWLLQAKALIESQTAGSGLRDSCPEAHPSSLTWRLTRAGGCLFDGCGFGNNRFSAPQAVSHRSGKPSLPEKLTPERRDKSARLRSRRHHSCVRNLLSFRKYLAILSMMSFEASGDALLARDVKQSGAIDIHHILNVFGHALYRWFPVFGKGANDVLDPCLPITWKER
jgi:hypothetical protein